MTRKQGPFKVEIVHPSYQPSKAAVPAHIFVSRDL